MTDPAAVQPLAGLRVLDFSTLVPGPAASLILAEAGARVIKIERPDGGDALRHISPKWGRDAISFAMLNRGKESLALDLKNRHHLAFLEPLLREADILLEQFRPGVMVRLGLGYKALKAINPGLIYCSITGYGQNGPKAGVAGHDLNFISDTGLLSLSPGGETPVVPPVLAADLAGGCYPAVVNILLALLARQKTGQGTWLDISMTDNVFMLMAWAVGQAISHEQWPRPGGELLTGGSPRYRLYPARDGKLIAVAALEQRFWEVFCDLIGLAPADRNDADDPQACAAAIGEILLSKPSDHWKRLFYGHDCCCSVVASLHEALGDAHFRERGLFDQELENELGQKLPASPVCVAPQFRDHTGKAKSAPFLGAHNDILLREKRK